MADCLATVPPEVARWSPLARAQHLEMKTLLSGYLLSAQGDRMLMGNSVEGRFPFLDHRVIELAARLPPTLKMKVLREKYVLKRHAARWLPPAVLRRPKQPYRAPVGKSLRGPDAAPWCAELLSRRAVDEVGVFDGAKVDKLLQKLAAQPGEPSEADNMAVMAVASTQLLVNTFRSGYPVPDQAAAGVKVVLA